MTETIEGIVEFEVDKEVKLHLKVGKEYYFTLNMAKDLALCLGAQAILYTKSSYINVARGEPLWGRV